MEGDNDGLMVWPDLLERPRPKPEVSVRYGRAVNQSADLWLPDGPSPHPTVLMVHGGCWQSDIADRHIMSWIAEDLRRRGIAVWNIEYRGVDRTGGGYPGTFQDVAAAADALRLHGPRHGLDLAHLVAVGHSAGGHLALWLGARSLKSRPAFLLRFETPSPEAEPLPPPRHLSTLLAVTQGVTGVEFVRVVRESDPILLHIFLADAFRDAPMDELRRRLRKTDFAIAEIVDLRLRLPPDSPFAGGDPLPLRAIVSLGGLPDLEEASRPPGSGCGTEVVEALTGGRFEDTSVPRLAPLGIRQILVNGRQDKIVPAHYAEDYARQMRAAGDEVEVHMIDRTGHIELIAPESAAWGVAAEAIENALRR